MKTDYATFRENRLVARYWSIPTDVPSGCHVRKWREGYKSKGAWIKVR